MKKLKLDHSSAEQVKEGTLTATCRLFDDKDLSVDDKVLLIDKVNEHDPTTWKPIGTAFINEVIQKRLIDLTAAERQDCGYGQGTSLGDVVVALKQLYGSDVTENTPVKIVRFHFSDEIAAIGDAEVLLRTDKATIYADGGSRGNPGPSAAGYVIYNEQKQVLVYKGVYLGITTNNQAEYTALKLALEDVKNLAAREVSIYMDSLLVINQMRGVFKVKNRDLWPIHEAVQQLAGQFKRVSFVQIPREMNKLADAAVNQALDRQLDSVKMVHEQAKR